VLSLPGYSVFKSVLIKKACPSSTDRLWSFGFSSPAVPSREDALLLCYRQVSWLSAFPLRSGPSHPIRDSGNLIFTCQSPNTVARPRRLFTAFPNLNKNNYIGAAGSVKTKIKKCLIPQLFKYNQNFVMLSPRFLEGKLREASCFYYQSRPVPSFSLVYEGITKIRPG
jgi:hypothetical protein